MLKQNFDVQLSENEKVPRNKGLFKIQKIPLDFLEWEYNIFRNPLHLKMEDSQRLKEKNVFSRPK